ncbi:hypothetical protein BJY52DRAFT_1305129 [Lactarius psammicola]|nr:hypothetical protein BJY52DRAFT_1305129 [Lactarius psammicola]
MRSCCAARMNAGDMRSPCCLNMPLPERYCSVFRASKRARRSWWMGCAPSGANQGMPIHLVPSSMSARKRARFCSRALSLCKSVSVAAPTFAPVRTPSFSSWTKLSCAPGKAPLLTPGPAPMRSRFDRNCLPAPSSQINGTSTKKMSSIRRGGAIMNAATTAAAHRTERATSSLGVFHNSSMISSDSGVFRSGRITRQLCFPAAYGASTSRIAPGI